MSTQKLAIAKVRYEVITQEDEGDILIPIPPKLLAKLGWTAEDKIEIGIDETGRYILKRVDND